MICEHILMCMAEDIIHVCNCVIMHIWHMIFGTIYCTTIHFLIDVSFLY